MSPPDLAEKKVGKYWLMTFVNFNSLVFKMTKIDTGHQKTGKFLKKNLFKRYELFVKTIIFLIVTLLGKNIKFFKSMFQTAIKSRPFHLLKVPKILISENHKCQVSCHQAESV